MTLITALIATHFQLLLDNPVCPCSLKGGHCASTGQAKAAADTSIPSHFHLLALTSCVSKVFIILVKKTWLLYMVNKHFLHTAIMMLLRASLSFVNPAGS